uniref:AF4/FMR2 family member lilli n=1 Tax=Heterorhabditis bacteriophora TaxID=37862 RepID=A0A1I7XPW5_HETBA
MKIEPRPSSSQDVGDVFREFKCASSECCPPKAVRPEKPEPESTERLCDFYQSVARVRKRKADGESDKVQRMLLYLDCVVYFTLSAKHFQTSDGTENKASRQVTIVRDTCELLKLVTQHFTKPSDNISPLHHHLMSRVRNLSLRVQAVLAYHLYNFRSQQAFKAYTVLTQMDPHVIEEKKADATPSAGGGKTTPSPSSSVHSNSNQGVNTISMPTHVYQIQKQQLKTLHHLMWAHRIWGDAAERAGGNSADMTFITSLEKVCGHLCVDAPLEKMSSYLLTGVAWLRTEYEREKRRPPPPISAKRLS